MTASVQTSTRDDRRPAILGTVAVVASLVLLAMLKQIYIGNEAFAESEAAVQAGDLKRAITATERAAEAVVPGRWVAHRAAERLATLAEYAESKQDTEAALAGWHALRAAATSTDAPVASTDAWRERAHAGILRVSRNKEASGDSPTSEPVMVEAVVRDQLERTYVPSSAMQGVLASLAILLLAAIVFVGQRSLEKE